MDKLQLLNFMKHNKARIALTVALPLMLLESGLLECMFDPNRVKECAGIAKGLVDKLYEFMLPYIQWFIAMFKEILGISGVHLGR